MPDGLKALARSWPTTRITLLRRIADPGDRASWEAFASTYGPLIHRYCLRRGLQEADACDVVQEVLFQVNRSIDGFRFDPARGRFRNWLGTVTHRAMLKHLARSRKPPTGTGDARTLEALAAEPCPEPLGDLWTETFNSHVYRVAMGRIRGEFDAETWRAFVATFAEERPPRQVAEDLGRTVGWVYQAKSQVVRRLRTEILELSEDSALLNLASNLR